VKLEQIRPNIFSLTATSHELSALVAAGRMAADAMQEDPKAPPEALELLNRVLREFDAARAGLRDENGR
jgi:hypothetical protein